MYCIFSLEPKQWDCETCQADLAAISEGSNCEHNIGKLLDILAGEALCQNPSLVASDEQSEMCYGFAKNFVPAAIKYLTGKMVEYSEEYCFNVFDVCN